MANARTWTLSITELLHPDYVYISNRFHTAYLSALTDFSLQCFNSLHLQIFFDEDFGLYGGFPKMMGFPNQPMGIFLLQTIMTWGIRLGGVSHHLRETPIIWESSTMLIVVCFSVVQESGLKYLKKMEPGQTQRFKKERSTVIYWLQQQKKTPAWMSQEVSKRLVSGL